MTCARANSRPAPGAVPKAADPIRFYHTALRRDVGDDLGMREFCAPTASGQPTTHEAVRWDNRRSLTLRLLATP